MQFVKDYQFLIFMIFQACWGGVTWWFGRNVATKDDVARNRKDIEGVGSRVSLVEAQLAAVPSDNDIANLHLEMERTRGQIATFTAELRGAQQTMSAQTEGVSKLLNRAESMLNLLIENALAGGRDR